jgi:hypothetical protein
MLRIRQTKHLVELLKTTQDELNRVVESPDEFYELLWLHDPQRPDKPRKVVNVLSTMRAFQQTLYRRILLPKLKPSAFSHGCVKGKSIKTNVQPHVGSAFALRLDISNFYPSVHYTRIYRLFTGPLECSPDVARYCTKICTFRHHLALGLITSPILADQVLRPVDNRLATACEKAGLVYTRYVDDIAISGPFNLERSGFAKLAQRILDENGFEANPDKNKFGRLSDGFTITNLREVNGHLDVRREYVDELTRQLLDAAALARDDEFQGPYYTPSQILGRVRFVCWVNPGRRKELIRRFRSINWYRVRQIARTRQYESTRKKLTPVVG